jgi:hypothetical protein
MKKFEQRNKPTQLKKTPEKKPNRLAQLALGTAAFALSHLAPSSAIAANTPQVKANQEPTRLELLSMKPSMVITNRSQVRQAVWLGQIKVGDVVEIQGKKMLIKGDSTGKVGRNTIEELEKVSQTIRVTTEQELDSLFTQNLLRVGDTITLANGEKKYLAGQKFSNGEVKVTRTSLRMLGISFTASNQSSQVSPKLPSSANHTQKLIELVQQKTANMKPETKPLSTNNAPKVIAAKTPSTKQSDLSQFLSKPINTKQATKPVVDSTPISTALNNLEKQMNTSKVAPTAQTAPTSKPTYNIAQGRPINEEKYPGLRGPKLLYIDGVTTTEKDYRRIISQCESFIAPNATTPIECKMAIGMVLRNLIQKEDWNGVDAVLSYHANDAKDRWEVFPDDWSEAYSKAISNFDYKTSFFKDATNRAKLTDHVNSIAVPQAADFSNQLRSESRQTLMSLAGALSREGVSVLPRTGVGIDFLNGNVGLRAATAKTDKQMNSVIQQIVELSSTVGAANNQKIQLVANRVVQKRIETLLARKNIVTAYYPVFSKMATLSYHPSALIDQEIAALQHVKVSLRNINQFVK